MQMRKCFVVLLMLAAMAGFWWWNSVRLAESAPVGPELIITQAKVTSTDGQFITLYNNTAGVVDLNDIQLQYFNNYDLAAATSSKLIKLTGQIAPHGYAVVNDGAIQACYQMTVNSVSLGLSTTAGFLQVSHYLGDSPHVVSILDDYVGWSKKIVPGAQTLPTDTSSFLQRQAPGSSSKLSLIQIPGDGSWQSVKQLNGGSPCGPSQTSGALGGGSLAPGSAAIPYTVNTASAVLSSIPKDDSGLMAPQISEVVPNPAPPKTDANDEFIELYNSNAKPFDLSGFILQVGTTTIHKYTFPDGTTIEPTQFTAFSSSDTNLSLSNSDGQVKLLDPAGNVLNKTDEYTGAKDDYAWIKAGGLWQWTTTPTPGAANLITAPASKAGSSSGSGSSAAKKGSVLAATTNSGSGGGTPSAVQMHPLVLAGVGAAALLYALYEYRHDLGNFIYKLRRNREARRIAG